MSEAEIRYLQPGDIVFVRARIKSRLKDTKFGEWEVEQINRVGVPIVEGEYLYVRDEGIVSIEEARRAVKR